MSVLDLQALFSGTPQQKDETAPAPAPAPAPAQQQPAQQPPAHAPNATTTAPQTRPANSAHTWNNQPHDQVPQSTDANGKPVAQTDPAQQPAAAPQPAQPTNPLDFFKDLGNNEPVQGAESIQAPAFTLDPKTVSQAASQVDFTQGLDADLVAKVQAGDLSALLPLLQGVGQNAYAQSLQHGAALAERHVSNMSDYQSKTMAPLVREHLTTNALETASVGEGVNIDMSNPIVREAVSRTAKELAQKNPTASPDEIARQAKSYHIQMASTMLGMNSEALANLPAQFQQQQNQQAAEVTDWDTYLV